MSFLHSPPSTATTSLVILLLVVLPYLACSQAPTTPSPTLTDCVSHLLPLSPCAPYVQGTVQSPAQMCCVNLKQVYSQHPSCLCLLLNGTALSSMPINTTLALHLPDACRLQVDVSTCSGAPVPVPSSPTGPQISLGSNTNSTVAASPMAVPVPPRSTTITGLGPSSSTNLNPSGQLSFGAAGSITAILFAIHLNLIYS